MTPFLDGALRWIYPSGPPPECPRCGYDWSIDPRDACDVIAATPDRLERVLSEGDGMVPQADGSWNATAYLWHLADLASSWSERWVQIEAMPGSRLVGWDPDELADVRNYRSLPTPPALWALRAAVEAFTGLSATMDLDTSFEHGDWGQGDVGDGLRWLGHEFHHHTRDVIARVG